jgi:hypothetical protein
MEKLVIIAMEAFRVGPAEGIPDVAADDAAINGALEQVFIFVGGLAVLFLVIGGIRYSISNGDASQIQQAKNTILYAVIGLIIAVSAFAIIQFVAGEVS